MFSTSELVDVVSELAVVVSAEVVASEGLGSGLAELG